MVYNAEIYKQSNPSIKGLQKTRSYSGIGNIILFFANEKYFIKIQHIILIKI